MSNGDTYGIKEFRTNDCWGFPGEDNENANFDISLMILDRPIPGAKKGVHYVDIWNTKTMGNVVGKKFTLTGFGGSGVIRDDGRTNQIDEEAATFHRGYNVYSALYQNVL